MTLAQRIERAIGAMSPAWQEHREMARARMEYARHAADEIRRLRNYAEFGYRGAVQTRLESSWSASSSRTGTRHLRLENLQSMRDRSRGLDRNNVIAAGLLDRVVENVVGSGFTPQATTPDRAWNRMAEQLWRDWEERCDVREYVEFRQMQALVLRAVLRDGDVGINLLPETHRLQAIEGDLIVTPNSRLVDSTVVDGVELNRVGRPLAFHISTGDTIGLGKTKPISAANFVFLPRLKRLNQVRGEPAFSQVFPLFDQVDGYLEAVVVAARMAACYGLLFREPSHVPGTLPVKADAAGTNRPKVYLEPGMTKWIGEADEVIQVKPEQPTQSMPEFVATLLRFCGLHLGLPLELIYLDFSRTNYSSARAALLQAWRSFEALQLWFERRFLRRIWRWNVSHWIKEGELPDPGMVDGRPVMWDHQWQAPPWQWVDPVKEAQAIAMGLDLNLTTLRDEAAKLGRDWEDLLDQRIAELRAQKAGGIVEVRSNLTRDPQAAGGAAPAAKEPNGTRGDEEPEDADAVPA